MTRDTAPIIDTKHREKETTLPLSPQRGSRGHASALSPVESHGVSLLELGVGMRLVVVERSDDGREDSRQQQDAEDGTDDAAHNAGDAGSTRELLCKANGMTGERNGEREGGRRLHESMLLSIVVCDYKLRWMP